MHFNIPNLFDRLKSDQRILIAGCGGGYDIYCGIPVFLALRRLGYDVELANLTFTAIQHSGSERISRYLHRVHHGVEQKVSYFPELDLCRWLHGAGDPHDVYAFKRTGVQNLRRAYRKLVEGLDIDVILLVDGGTDSLMRGDEDGLGTPHEDALSMVAVAGLGIPAFLLCLGFGVDAFHGVCHAHFLENTAALSRDGAFLGTTSLLPQMDEAQRYLELVDWSVRCNLGRPSIVNTSIATAVQGHYGDVHATFRTEGSRLWINPLMSIYWTYELGPVVDRIVYREALEPTESFEDLVGVLQPIIRRRGGKRPKQPIPV